MLVSKRVRRFGFLMKLLFTGLMISPAVTGEADVIVVRVPESAVFVEMAALDDERRLLEDIEAMVSRCERLLGPLDGSETALVLELGQFGRDLEMDAHGASPKLYAEIFRWWASQTVENIESWLLDGLSHYQGYLMALERSDMVSTQPTGYAFQMRKAFFEDPRSGTMSLIEASHAVNQKKYSKMLGAGSFLVMEALHGELVKETELNFSTFVQVLWKAARDSGSADSGLLVDFLSLHAPVGIDLIETCVHKAGFPPGV